MDPLVFVPGIVLLMLLVFITQAIIVWRHIMSIKSKSESLLRELEGMHRDRVPTPEEEQAYLTLSNAQKDRLRTLGSRRIGRLILSLTGLDRTL